MGQGSRRPISQWWPQGSAFDDWRAMATRARDRGELAEGLDVDAVLLTLECSPQPRRF